MKGRGNKLFTSNPSSGATLPGKRCRADISGFRGFHTSHGGLFLLLPFLRLLGFENMLMEAGLERNGIPMVNFSLALLALKCSGAKRYSHGNDFEDDGLALWAGLNKLPDQSWLHSFAKEFTAEGVDALFLSMGRRLKQLYHIHGSRVNVDFHSIPAYGDTGEEAWVPTRGKSMSCKRAMFLQDQESTVPILATTDFKGLKPSRAVLLAANTSREIFGRSHLVMDSQVTTYAVLNELDKGGFGFTTLRRRGKKLVERVESLSRESFEVVELDNPRRAYRRVRVLDERTTLKDYEGEVRQIVITDHGREKPTFLVTNDFESLAKDIITTYTWRWRVENNIEENVDFFALDKLPSYLSIKVDVDLFFTLLGVTCTRCSPGRLMGTRGRSLRPSSGSSSGSRQTSRWGRRSL